MRGRVEALRRRVAELEGQLDDDYSRMSRWAREHLALRSEIPSGYPDGTGILSPIAWVRWAKQELGYATHPTERSEPS